jgi:cell wall-associated NlpC family hydrolase
MTRRDRLAARLAVAALITITATIGVSTVSSAAPSKQDVQAAQARVNQLNQQMSLLVEQYDQEQTRLQEIQGKLAGARAAAQQAQATADAATQQLNERAASVYTRTGSELEVLLGADSFAEFSDRLEYVGSLAQADTDIATKAQHAQQQAQWAGQQLQDLLQQQQDALSALRDKQSQVKTAIANANSELTAINKRYHDYLDAQAAAQAAQAAAASTFSNVTPPPGGPPPAPNPNAQAAIDAAYSVIGTPYVWGAADPSVGFDCSGLTMWSWAHAGVGLPHSSAMQYAVLPHISPSDAQPGDLVFFYSPISHVGLYIGGGRMIDANHTGDVVNIRPVYWSSVTGVARP